MASSSSARGRSSNRSTSACSNPTRSASGSRCAGMADARGTVGLLGGGVIGGGWAARYVLGGIDVRIFDPAPDAARRVEEVLAGARRAVARLTLAPLPPGRALSFGDTVEAAVVGVAGVHESAPERGGLQRELPA